MKARILSVAVTLALAAVGAQAAGTVEVKAVNPEKFFDIGFSSVARERNLEILTDFVKKLGKRLPDGQVLQVELLNVDLAGQVNPMSVHEVRVVRGLADAPAIQLRYTLLNGNTTVASGEDRLTDLDYMHGSVGGRYAGTEMPYEKRMIQRWFDEKIAPRKVAGAPR